MTFEDQVSGRILVHLIAQTFQFRVGGFAHFRFVETKLNVQGFAHVLGQVLLTAFIVNLGACRRIRALVLAVHDAVAVVIQLTALSVNTGARGSAGAAVVGIRYTVVVAVGGGFGNRLGFRLFVILCADQNVQGGVDLAVPALGAEAVCGACADVDQEVVGECGLYTELDAAGGFLEIIVAFGVELGAGFTGAETDIAFDRAVAVEVTAQAGEIVPQVHFAVAGGHVVAIVPGLYGPVFAEAITDLGAGHGHGIVFVDVVGEVAVAFVVITDIQPALADVTTQVEIPIRNGVLGNGRSGNG